MEGSSMSSAATRTSGCTAACSSWPRAPIEQLLKTILDYCQKPFLQLLKWGLG
jgi:hypothetical protein